MDINSEEYEQEVLIKDVVMLAARMLLESGAEGMRVEDTMTRIAKKLGYSESNNFVTNTVIQFTLHSESSPRTFRTTSRDTNLIKISQVNEISHQITNNEVSLAEVKTQLEKIYVAKRNSSLPFKGFATAMTAMSFLYLQGGRSINILTAILAGSLGYLVTEILDCKLHAQFIPGFIGSLVTGIITAIGHALIPAGDLVTIIITAAMPIVPGILITNAIQDLLDGHMLVFIARSLEALVTAFGIGAGVGSVLILVQEYQTMFWILSLIFSLLISMSLCVIFDAPRKLYLSCGFVGMCGWMVHILFFNGFNVHTMYSSFFGSLASDSLSHYMARRQKESAIIFMVTGIIPLVSGGLAYDAIKNLVLLNFSTAINTMLEATLITGAIASGLLFADQISKLIVSGFVKPLRRL